MAVPQLQQRWRCGRRRAEGLSNSLCVTFYPHQFPEVFQSELTRSSSSIVEIQNRTQIGAGGVLGEAQDEVSRRLRELLAAYSEEKPVSSQGSDLARSTIDKARVRGGNCGDEVKARSEVDDKVKMVRARVRKGDSDDKVKMRSVKDED